MSTTRLPERAHFRFALATLIGAGGVLCFAPFGLFWLAPVVWLGISYPQLGCFLLFWALQARISSAWSPVEWALDLPLAPI